MTMQRVFGYFANAQYDKNYQCDKNKSARQGKINRYDTKSVWYDKTRQDNMTRFINTTKKDKTNLLANFSLFFCEFYNFARKLK